MRASECSSSTRAYARRQPEATVLYDVVSDHLPALLDRARSRSAHGFGYPRFVEREFEKFLACGLLCHGFVRVRCGDCGDERLVAFSCKTRGFCPSCTSRRMTSTAAHLVDRVLPTAPYRQWVLSLPRQVRFLLARDHGLLGELVGIFLRKVFAWQRRRARSQGIAKPHTGAVTFVQRFGSLLNLNCHAHALLPTACSRRVATAAWRFTPRRRHRTTTSHGYSHRSPARSTADSSGGSTTSATIRRSICSRPSKPKRSPACRLSATRRGQPPVADLRSSPVTHSTPIASSTPTIAMASSACVAMARARPSRIRGSRATAAGEL